MKRWILGSVYVMIASTSILIPQQIAYSSKTTQANLDSKVIAAASSKPVASGSFQTIEQNHPTSGMAKIVAKNGKCYLIFDKHFKTAQGPDVQVILHRNRPVPVEIKKQNYLTIAPLQSTSGKQVYELPDNIDLNEFEAVTIWCRRFKISFSYAPLK